MTPEDQNAFLLNLLNRLFHELAVYRVYVEGAKLGVGEKDVNDFLSEVRERIDLREFVDSFVRGLGASLFVAGPVDPDQALREFLSQFELRRKPN